MAKKNGNEYKIGKGYDSKHIEKLQARADNTRTHDSGLVSITVDGKIFRMCPKTPNPEDKLYTLVDMESDHFGIDRTSEQPAQEYGKAAEA